MTRSGSKCAKVITYLRARFRTLDDADDRSLARFNTLPAGPTREEFIAASTLPEAVSKFLFQLDVKLDAILAGIHSSALERDFPHGMEILAISASEIEFTTGLPLAPGDRLELVINICQGGISTVSGIGTVTRRTVAKNGEPVFSFSFTRITEEEREKIIRFVFQEERRRLRETRLEQNQ